ncbi:hypothetical protein MRX96_042615 [Rhipicephalus microplus]
MPTYGGGYRKEPELQSNYKALLSEPDFGSSVPPSINDAAVVAGSTRGVQDTAAGAASTNHTDSGAQQEKTPSEEATDKTADSEDCKDKSTKTVVHSNDQSVQHSFIDPVSREAAQAEIIAALKLRAGKNGSSEQPNTQTEISGGKRPVSENSGVISDSPVQAATPEHASVPLSMSEKKVSSSHQVAQNAVQAAGAALMDHGMPSEVPKENIQLSNSEGSSELAVSESLIPGYGSPETVGVFYTLENVASQRFCPV